MAIEWPSGVPAGLLVVTPVKGFGRDNTVRNDISARRISTKTSRRFDAQIRMTKAQFVVFDAWYYTTLKDGSLPFQGITDPRTGANTVWMFVAEPNDENVPGTHNLIDVSMQLLALPDAPFTYEGFGAGATGGAGGQVIHVTNLNNSGAGSLRAAVEASGPRTVVFDVGGDIVMFPPGGAFPLNRTRMNITSGDLTIAGETAPAPGITLKFKTDEVWSDINAWGAVFNFQSCSNIIIRHMAFRPDIYAFAPGETPLPSNVIDNMFIFAFGDSTVAGSAVNNVVIDHCSFSHSGSRCISVSDSCSDWTISNCIFGPGLTPTVDRPWLTHSKGFSNHQGSTRMSIINSIYAHLSIRMPQVGGVFDVRGNIIYDWGNAATQQGFGGYIHNSRQTVASGPDVRKDTQVNWIGNKILTGGAQGGSSNRGLIAQDWRNNPGNTPSDTGSTLQFYLDNIAQLGGPPAQSMVTRWNVGLGATENVSFVGSEYQAVTPFVMPPVTMLSANDVKAMAGRYPRDAVDTQVVADVTAAGA